MKTYKPPQFLFNSCIVFQYTDIPYLFNKSLGYLSKIQISDYTAD